MKSLDLPVIAWGKLPWNTLKKGIADHPKFSN